MIMAWHLQGEAARAFAGQRRFHVRRGGRLRQGCRCHDDAAQSAERRREASTATAGAGPPEDAQAEPLLLQHQEAIQEPDAADAHAQLVDDERQPDAGQGVGQGVAQVGEEVVVQGPRRQARLCLAVENDAEIAPAAWRYGRNTSVADVCAGVAQVAPVQVDQERQGQGQGVRHNVAQKS